MADPRFFTNVGPFTLQQLADEVGAVVHDASHADKAIEDVAPLDKAGPDDISFLDNKKYTETFQQSQAGACIIKEKFAEQAPKEMALLIAENPYLAYAQIASKFYPDTTSEETTIADGAIIDPSASIGENCIIYDGVVIGPGVEIGDNCTIYANVSISHSIIGNSVMVHQGASIGQDGFGFATDAQGKHIKVPQLGRVIIEDDVEIGANTTIDRGAGPDTLIGQGTRIDNLVQIGHNVVLGKGCVVVAQVGISGSTKVGDYAMLGGQVGISGHLDIGAGVQVSAQSGVTRSVPAKTTVGGTPAVPITQYHRQTVALEKLVNKKGNNHD